MSALGPGANVLTISSIVLGEAHLRRILRSYARYYNDIRTHRSLDKDAPVSRPVQRTGSIKSHPLGQKIEAEKNGGTVLIGGSPVGRGDYDL